MMFARAIKTQTIFLLQRKISIAVFFILLLVVAQNFIGNVLLYCGYDISAMYQPMRLLALSNNSYSSSTMLLVQLYPILVVCPAGFSLAREYQIGEDVLMIAQLGRSTYYWSKLLAAFLTTTIVFCVPFLIEIVLNCISFPLSATGNLMEWHPYRPEYIQSVSRYLWKQLYLLSPYLYAVVGTLIFGIVSGILGAFTAALSVAVNVKYRVVLFLPVFLLLNGTIYLPHLLSADFQGVEWYHYILLFDDKTQYAPLFLVSLLLLLAALAAAICRSIRKDGIT